MMNITGRKKQIITILSIVISFVVFFLAMMTEAHAQQPAKTYYLNPIQISGLGNFQGKSLTVYYALGSRGSLNNQQDQITIREVKEKKTFAISSDKVTIPEMNLKRSNVFITYNILVFVIHDGNQFSWINGNRTLPEGEQGSSNMQYFAVDSLTKIEFDQLKNGQSAAVGTPIKYQFGQGVPAEPLEQNQ